VFSIQKFEPLAGGFDHYSYFSGNFFFFFLFFVPPLSPSKKNLSFDDVPIHPCCRQYRIVLSSSYRHSMILLDARQDRGLVQL
jgi:hypothetical protein